MVPAHINPAHVYGFDPLTPQELGAFSRDRCLQMPIEQLMEYQQQFLEWHLQLQHRRSVQGQPRLPRPEALPLVPGRLG